MAAGAAAAAAINAALINGGCAARKWHARWRRRAARAAVRRRGSSARHLFVALEKADATGACLLACERASERAREVDCRVLRSCCAWEALPPGGHIRTMSHTSANHAPGVWEADRRADF
eukprot:291161-Chlamydomonas_euryale.AAC.4